MGATERAERAFKELVAEGRQILSAAGWNGSEYQRHPPENDYFRFRTSAINLVRRVCGDDSEHYRELKRPAESKETANVPYYMAHLFGVVEAAERDFRDGLVFDMRALIEAEILGDFIDQAEALLEAGYQVPAASLAGAVLEDTLRKLCERHGINYSLPTKIDRLSADLARHGVYDKLVQKRITALADIRNNADHGHFDKFSEADVADMAKWVRSFAADHLS